MQTTELSLQIFNNKKNKDKKDKAEAEKKLEKVYIRKPDLLKDKFYLFVELGKTNIKQNKQKFREKEGQT